MVEYVVDVGDRLRASESLRMDFHDERGELAMPSPESVGRMAFLQLLQDLAVTASERGLAVTMASTTSAPVNEDGSLPEVTVQLPAR